MNRLNYSHESSWANRLVNLGCRSVTSRFLPSFPLPPTPPLLLNPTFILLKITAFNLTVMTDDFYRICRTGWRAGRAEAHCSVIPCLNEMSECYTAWPLTFVFQDGVTVCCINTFLSCVNSSGRNGVLFCAPQHTWNVGAELWSSNYVSSTTNNATCSLPSSDVINEPVPADCPEGTCR